MRRANSTRRYRPKVSAATAGPKTSPTIAKRLFAISTPETRREINGRRSCGQDDQCDHDQPALGACCVNGGSDRSLRRKAKPTAYSRHEAHCGLAPVLIGHQEDIEKRTERAADVGKQEVYGIER
jgi:hypothetical protein